MDVISRMFLLSGQDLELAPGVKVRHPTIADILAINHGFLCEDYYWTYVCSLLSDPYDSMVYLDDNGIDYEKVTAFDVFVLRWADAKQDYIKNREQYQIFDASSLSMMRNALEFFFGPHKYDLIKVGDQIVLADMNDLRWYINGEAFALATDFILKCNCIVRDDKINPANKNAKRILIEDRRMEERRQIQKSRPSEKVEQIADALVTVFSGGAGTITPDNYADKHIYQLLSTSKAVQKQMVVQSMLNGIYTGMIKTDKMPDKELRWV